MVVSIHYFHKSGCPDYTNEELKVSSLQRDETSLSCVCPIIATSCLWKFFLRVVGKWWFSSQLDVWSNEQVSTWQNNDIDISKILNLKSLFDHKPPKDHVAGLSYECSTLWSLWETLEVKDGILYFQSELDSGEDKLILVAPSRIRDNIFHELQETRTAGPW